MAVALATLAGISERRIEQMTNPQTSLLPAFLVKDAGLNSGFMILQVTAAALVADVYRKWVVGASSATSPRR